MTDGKGQVYKTMRFEWGGQSGQALVEMALTVPMLVLLLLGAVEFGRVAYISIQVSNAAKAAAQYGAQTLDTAVDQAGMQAVAQADASSLAAGTVTVNLSSNCSCSSPCNTPGASCPSPSHIEQNITIVVSAPFNPLITVPGLPNSFNLTGTAVQKRLQ
jgi:Flp pilus assembly protein TadG